MRANRRVSNREIRFRAALWDAGARGYRVTPRLPGRPDVVFPGIRLAVFVHGCFWHRCPVCRPAAPKANSAFWEAKFHQNEARDQRVSEELVGLGWDVETVWEHEIRPDPRPRAQRLASEVRRRRDLRESARG